MNKEQIKKVIEIVKEKQESYDVDLYSAIQEDDLKDISSVEELEKYFNDLNEDGDITNEEVIYYASAIEYLKENDPSLNESIELAKGYGYTIDNINSELLATLLKSQNNQEELNDLINDIVEELKEASFTEEES
jgi:hypothetical protein